MKKSQNFEASRRDLLITGLAGGAASFLTSALGPMGAGLLTALNPSRAHAAVTTPKPIPSYTVNLSNYGGAPGASVSTNINAFNSAYNALKSMGGGTLVIPPGTYQLGSYGSNTSAVNVNGLSNVLISGYGATLSITTTATAVPSILHFQNPNNVTVAGLSFYDPGADVSINWRGAVCVQVDCTVACDGVKVVDCVANHCLTLFKAYGGGGSLNYLLTGLDIQGTCTDCYYGVNVNNTGRYSKVQIKTTRVRRAYICYGARNWDIFIDASVDGPQGSNALCELPTSVAGPIVSDLNISMKVSGNLAWHSGLVTFFHQEDPNLASSFENIKADIQVSNATSLPGNGMFYFLYWDGSQLQSSTSKIWKNIQCTGSLDAQSAALFAGANKIIGLGAVSTSSGNSVSVSSYFQKWQSLAGMPSYFSWFTPTTTSPAPSPSPSPAPAPSPADVTAPTVSVTSPLSGASFKRGSTIQITASASDNVSVAKVEFYVNGLLVGSRASAPYTVNYTLSGKRNASYSLQAKAYDASGNVGTSAVVKISSSRL